MYLEVIKRATFDDWPDLMSDPTTPPPLIGYIGVLGEAGVYLIILTASAVQFGGYRPIYRPRRSGMINSCTGDKSNRASSKISGLEVLVSCVQPVAGNHAKPSGKWLLF